MTDRPADTASLPPRSARRRRIALRLAIGTAVAASVWTAAIGWALPAWLKPRIEAAASDALGTRVTLEALTVQPWTLLVAADNLRIATPAGGPADAAPTLVTLARAEARLSPQSLWRLAPVLHSLTLTEPEVQVERWARGRFSFTPVLEHLRARPTTADDGEPARFALHNIRIHDGALRYHDRVLNQRHAVEALQLGVPFLSNLASDLDVEVEPLLEARIDGSVFKLSGDSKPFAPGRPTDLTLNWSGVALAPWGAALKPLLPPSARVDLTRGTLDSALTLRFDAPTGQPARLAVRGRVALQDVAAQWPAGGWSGQWSSLVLDGLDIAPLARQAALGSITLDGLRVTQGKPVPIAATQAAPSPQPVGATQSTHWVWSVGRVQVAAQDIHLQAGGQPLPVLGPIELRAERLSSDAKAAPATLHASAADDAGSRFTADGTLRPAVPRAQLTLALRDGAPLAWLRALKLALPVQLQRGRAELQTRLSVDAGGLQLEDGRLQLTQVQVQPQVQPTNGPTRSTDRAADHLDWSSLALTGVAGQWRFGSGDEPGGLRRLTIADATIDRLDAAASRDDQQRWRWVPEATAKTTDKATVAAATPASAPASAAASASPPAPVIELRSLRCRACVVQVRDGSVTPAATWRLADVQLVVRGASTDLNQPLAVELTSRAQGNGTLGFKGTVRPQPLTVAGQVQAQALDLRAAQPYLAPLVNLTLLSAQAHADGRLAVDSGAAGALAVRWQGRAALSDLRTQDSLSGNDFVRWRSLALDGSDIAWHSTGAPLQADLGRVTLDDFFGRVIIHPDGHLNLRDVRKEVAGTRSLTTPQTNRSQQTGSSREPATTPATAQRPVVRWQRIALSNGRLDFTDNFVKPNYSARLQRLAGEISALGTAGSTEPAQVSLGGSLDDGAPVTVSGRIQPFGEQLFADVEAAARGIELTRLSTYAERWAGYAIDKGSLTANVHYQIQNGQLQATNRVFLDQLTFGDRVESPTATQLPVLLAVSLLKNSRGEIDVELPVAGSLNDPQFSVGGVIARVVGNLLLRAVSAPFSLLASATHGLTGNHSGEELGWVGFEPGSAQLTAASRDKLDTLAKQLADRPALVLEASGRADATVDAQGLRERHVARLLRAAKAQALGIDRRDANATEALQIAPAERERWLKAAYRAAEIKKPRNAIGLTRDLPAAEMEALLTADADTSPEALRALADRRADRVNAYLDTKLGADRVRLARSVVATGTSTGNDAAATPAGAPPSRVQFGLR